MPRAQRLTALCAVLALAIPLTVLNASGQTARQTPARPTLSGEIRRALADGGAEAAERRFAEMYPTAQAGYELDVHNLVALSTERMQAGDMAGAQAVMKMWTAILQDQQAAKAGGAAPPATVEPAGTPPPGTVDAGPRRTDLARFHGLYGDQPPSPRSLFVRETCDGHLQVGSLFGDVAPWTMRSESELAFVQAFVPPTQAMPPVRVEFVTAPDGTIEAVRHALTGERQRVPRAGPLPPGWPARDCGHGQ